MSTGVSEHQRNKGQGNSGNQSYGKNSGKDHHAGDHEENDSWRNQQGHHQGYGSSMNSEPYMPSYYGSFQQYPTYGVNEAGGPWSTNGGGDMGFVGGGGYHESSGGAHYNVDGMFGGGNGGGGGGGYGNFGGGQGQPSFGYGGFHGNGDYNAWGPQSRKHYDEYYRDGMYADDRMKMVEQGMGGLGLGNDKEMKDFKEMMTSGGGGGSKKTTWASIASQPAKPQSISKKTKPGMPPPPMIPGAWESKNGVVAKAPIAAPVQAPAWERPKVPPPVQPPPVQQPPPPPQSHQSHAPPSHPHGNQNIPPSRGYQQHQSMGYNMPPAGHQPPPPMIHNSHSSQNSQPPPPSTNHSNGNYSSPPPASPPGPKYPDEMKMKDYNPTSFDLLAEGSRFFVIKSYSEDDIHRSIKYEIWCSTEHGNKRLDEAFREREGKGPIYLFFSVNGSGHFCGMAQMISSVDYHASSSVWSQDKWKGQFKVKWIYVKDVPNPALRHIRLENNENKPVTNSRDTQEVPVDKGRQVLKIMHTFLNTTSIFDDFTHYEQRQEEEEVQRKVVQQPPPPPPDMRGHRGGGGGRGGFNDRGGFHGGNSHPGHNSRDRGDRDRPERDFGGRENPRDFRDHRGGRGDGFGMHPRNDRMDNRDHYNSRDRGDRDSFRDDRDGRDSRDSRDRGDSRDHHRGGGRGMGRPPMRREMN